jgi:hypothetical protein
MIVGWSKMHPDQDQSMEWMVLGAMMMIRRFTSMSGGVLMDATSVPSAAEVS